MYEFHQLSMVCLYIITVSPGAGSVTKPYFTHSGETWKLEMLMAAADWADGVISLSVT